MSSLHRFLFFCPVSCVLRLVLCDIMWCPILGIVFNLKCEGFKILFVLLFSHTLVQTQIYLNLFSFVLRIKFCVDSPTSSYKRTYANLIASLFTEACISAFLKRTIYFTKHIRFERLNELTAQFI